ncbi:hypothetical protein, partial [Aerococcus urinae]|uniref:hypothetical protein n=1 Tax=Aerococcus urinae TaxID=1376 RepID=UPI0025503A38
CLQNNLRILLRILSIVLEEGPKILDFVFCLQSLSHVQLFATPWTVALQAPLSMEFFRQE